MGLKKQVGSWVVGLGSQNTQKAQGTDRDLDLGCRQDRNVARGKGMGLVVQAPHEIRLMRRHGGFEMGLASPAGEQLPAFHALDAK